MSDKKGEKIRTVYFDTENTDGIVYVSYDDKATWEVYELGEDLCVEEVKI